ncbi:MAG: sugar ABC transporter permease [Arcanobacterium sp.]|nr:sugar ABC transporter permease [Arcanobacterium sp.]
MSRNQLHRRPVSRSEKNLRNVALFVILGAIVIFTFVPIVVAILGSFHNWNPLNGTFTSVGLDNYARMFTDSTFFTAVINTVVFGLVAIVGRLVLGLALAYALFSRMTKWRSFFRAVFYMPTVTPIVAVAYVWQLMYHPQFGAINNFFGLDINWLFDKNFAMPAILLMTIWKDFGYAVILFLAGLYAIPEDVVEAAHVDGANNAQTFLRVILPLLRPTTIFVVITSLIAYLQAFVQIMVLTGGGPGTATQTLAYKIYVEAFQNYNFGYASAIAIVLLVFTALLTAVSWKVQTSSGSNLVKRNRMKQRTVQQRDIKRGIA